jgi:hypothetical protein
MGINMTRGLVSIETEDKIRARITARNASRLLADEYVMKILSASFKTPRSAQELSLKFDIPIAVCYRKIKELQAVGLLKCVDRFLTREGKWVRLYQSQLVSAFVFYEKDKLRVKLQLACEVAEDSNVDTTWNVLEVPSKTC